MQALKALVIILGVMIVAGIAVLGVTVYHRAVNLVGNEAPATSPLPAFGVKNLSLPRGSEIKEMAAEGDRLILRVLLIDGSTRIVILDMASGERLGAFDAGRSDSDGP